MSPVRFKTIICNCKGLSASFRNSDMNTLPFEIESDLEVDYAIVQPQLCGEGGSKVMEEVLRSAEDDPDTIVIVGACEPKAQNKLFKEVLHKTDFDQKHLVAIDIRGATNEGILDRLRTKMEDLVQPKGKRH